MKKLEALDCSVETSFRAADSGMMFLLNSQCQVQIRNTHSLYRREGFLSCLLQFHLVYMTGNQGSLQSLL